MSNVGTAMIILAASIFLIVIVYFVFDTISMRQNERDVLISWPRDARPPWLDQETCTASTPRYIHVAEAEAIAEFAWYAWEPVSEGENGDDHH